MSPLTRGGVGKTVESGELNLTADSLLHTNSAGAAEAIADVATGQVLASQGTGTTPAYSDSPTLNGFTKLGSDAPGIKLKKLTGTTGATEGNTTSIAHGLTLSKIIGLNVLVTASNGNSIPPELLFPNEFEYNAFLTPTDVIIRLSSTNSGSILSGAIVVLLTHEV